MDAWHQDDRATIYHGDCLEVLRELPDASIDAVVTDPPYGINFMGKAWDAKFIDSTVDRRRQYQGHPETGPNGGYRSAAAEAGRYDQSLSGNQAFGAWCLEWTTECLRVLKPGGHMLIFGSTRTWHRVACAVEDAGFEIRDSIAWMYGSGFPKSLNVAIAIDKAAGKLGNRGVRSAFAGNRTVAGEDVAIAKAVGEHDPITDEAREWSGWGTALKPAHEPIVVARKPLVGTVAANVLEHGTGALNIDACRIQHDAKSAAWVEKWSGHEGHPEQPGWGSIGQKFGGSPAGRWPANVVLDESQAAELDQQSGNRPSRGGAAFDNGSDIYQPRPINNDRREIGYGDAGGASRFFYVAKAPARERPKVDGTAHPTVKPLTLMRWLCRLVTPPDGVILEPFAGSGTTVEAALLEGFRVVAIEREADYLPLIQARLDRVAAQEPEDEQLTLDASA